MGTSCKGVYKTYSAKVLCKMDKDGKQGFVEEPRACRCQAEPKEPKKKKPIRRATPKGKITPEYRPYKLKKNKYSPNSVGNTRKV
jgi:hypothetical protein